MSKCKIYIGVKNEILRTRVIEFTCTNIEEINGIINSIELNGGKIKDINIKDEKQISFKGYEYRYKDVRIIYQALESDFNKIQEMIDNPHRRED